MKTLLFSSFFLLNILLHSQAAWSQTKVGIALGGTLSRTAVDKEWKETYKALQVEIKDGFRKTGWLAGLYAQIPLSESLYGEAGFNVVNRGFRIRKERGDIFEMEENNLYLEIPIQLKKEVGNFSVQAGVKPGYWLTRTYVETGYNPQPVYYHGFYQMDEEFQRLNLGYGLGVGYKLPFYEGLKLSLEYTQLRTHEREVSFPLALRESSYFSLTVRMDLANTNQLVRDSLGVYFKIRVGTDIQLGYAAQLGEDEFTGKNPFAPKVGLVAGKSFGKWEVETGVLYLQRKKLFGGLMLIDGPIRALLHSGIQLRTAFIEMPVKVNYHLNSGFYATAGLSPQFRLSQRIEIYNRESIEDKNYRNEMRKQLWSVSGGVGYKLPAVAGHGLYIEATVQRGGREISGYKNPALAFVPLVASISLDVEL